MRAISKIIRGRQYKTLNIFPPNLRFHIHTLILVKLDQNPTKSLNRPLPNHTVHPLHLNPLLLIKLLRLTTPATKLLL